MGMLASLYTLSDNNIEKVIDNPLLLEIVTDQQDPHAYERARQREMPGLLQRLLGRKAPVRSDPANFVLADGEALDVDLDKAWHGLHYMLTRTAWDGNPPLNFIVQGGRDIDEYSRAFSAADVTAIDAALGLINTALLASRFDADEMDRLDIYPGIWANPENEALDYCLEHFILLKDFIHQAAHRLLGMVVCIG